MIGDQGFAAVPNYVWRVYDGPLALYCLLRYRADNETGQSWWSHDAIADDLGVSRQSVLRWMDKLEKAGHVVVERRVTPNGQTSNLYTVAGVLGVTDLVHPGVSNLIHELINNTQLELTTSTTTKNKKSNVQDRFDEFWKLYPRKVNKATAKKAWPKAVKKVGADHLIERVTAFANDPNLPEEQFICHGSTWLNQEQWENPPFPARKQNGRSESDDLKRGRSKLRELYEQGKQQQKGNDDETQ